MKETIKEIAQTIAVLLSTAPMTDEEKEKWAEVVPQMSIEQLDKFKNQLERMIVINVEADKELEKKLKGTKKWEDTEKKKLEKKASNEVDNLLKKIK